MSVDGPQPHLAADRQYKVWWMSTDLLIWTFLGVPNFCQWIKYFQYWKDVYSIYLEKIGRILLWVSKVAQGNFRVPISLSNKERSRLKPFLDSTFSSYWSVLGLSCSWSPIRIRCSVDSDKLTRMCASSTSAASSTTTTCTKAVKHTAHKPAVYPNFYLEDIKNTETNSIIWKQMNWGCITFGASASTNFWCAATPDVVIPTISALCRTVRPIWSSISRMSAFMSS